MANLEIPGTVSGRGFRLQGNRARLFIGSMLGGLNPPDPPAVGMLWFDQLNNIIKFCWRARTVRGTFTSDWVDFINLNSRRLAMDQHTTNVLAFPEPTPAEISQGTGENLRSWSPRNLRSMVLVHEQRTARATLVFSSARAPDNFPGRFWYRHTDDTLWISLASKWVRLAVLSDLNPRLSLKTKETPLPTGSQALLRAGTDTTPRLWSAEDLFTVILRFSPAALPLATENELVAGSIRSARAISPEVFRGAASRILAAQGAGSSNTLTSSDVSSRRTTPKLVTGSLVRSLATSSSLRSASSSSSSGTLGLVSGSILNSALRTTSSSSVTNNIRSGSTSCWAYTTSIVCSVPGTRVRFSSTGMTVS